MQNFEAALTEELKTIADLENRVYPLTAPEASAEQGVPYLIYGSSEGMRDKSISEGYLNSKQVSAEINVIAARYGDMKAITKQVLALLVSMELRTIGTNGPYIEELVYQEPVELYESEPNLYRCTFDIQVYFEEVG